MKIGDKVYVELEIEKIDESDNTFKGKLNYGIGYWFKNEVITQPPIQEGRWMIVSDDKGFPKTRFVVGKFKGCFIAITNADNENDLDLEDGDTTPWKYAKELPTKRKLTMQEIAEKFGIDKDNIEIEK